MYTVTVLFISIIINIPKFMETKIVTDWAMVHENNSTSPYNTTTYTIDVTDLRNNPTYIKYYMNVTRTVLLGILPFAALIFFNIRIYQRFLQTRRRYTRHSNKSSQVSSSKKRPHQVNQSDNHALFSKPKTSN